MDWARAKMKVKEVPLHIIKTLLVRLGGRGLEKLPVVHRIYVCYQWASFQGHKMYVSARDKVITPTLLNHGVWEAYQTKIFKRVIKKGMNVVDVGANIGWYTLIAARLVGKKGKVYAFEPEPYNCAILRKNVQLNGYTNTVIEQKAVLNRCQRTRLYLANDNLGDHRMFDSCNGRKWITVQGITLDEYFRNRHDRIDVIKVDIQGAEMAALLGMHRVIEANENLKLFVEFSPLLVRRSGFFPEDFIAKLSKYGFKFSVINYQKETLEHMHVDEIVESCEGQPLDYGINLFLEK